MIFWKYIDAIDHSEWRENLVDIQPVKWYNMAMKSNKSSRKPSSAKSPKFERLWNTPTPSLDSSPYWEPPTIGAELLFVGLCYMDKKGTPIKDEYLFNGTKVKISGEFNRLNIDDTGLVKDLEKAIDEVIKKHTKLKVHDKPTMIVPEEKK